MPCSVVGGNKGPHEILVSLDKIAGCPIYMFITNKLHLSINR